MRVLLDECVPRPLGRDLAGHECSTVAREGWAALKNGKLLAAAAESRWAVLLTTDKSIPWQQSVSQLRIGVLVVRVFSNDLEAMRRFVPEILAKLPELKPGTVAFIGEPRLLNK